MVFARVGIECAALCKADAAILTGYCLKIHTLDMDSFMLEPELCSGKAQR
jgi:hypothetical protein